MTGSLLFFHVTQLNQRIILAHQGITGQIEGKDIKMDRERGRERCPGKTERETESVIVI